ncbi:MAG: RIP metalloprotease RseP [Candidatus Lindowbacteria bacterium RIFCSPLOWO2_12_FULL_62_27]|nr:MAG: RIP metalloprotease RseP [Candidatus Lindowbacteria bacterium RIFCSPLOWO2_12_FULL_62_27]OGH58185.1 MAG: RIP metalloprotease RseP [Candidatus Lindowbacteria bacterium RIFCSPLOWO2_02_FULL_62_12]
MYILIGSLLVLGIAVLVHEFGHFVVARRNGVRVEEFCIGFPPRIFKFKKGVTQYSIGIIPVGGFVKMAGEDPESLSGAPDEFFSKSIPVRIRIALAGPFGNFVCAYFCVLIYLWTGGVQEALHAPVFGTPTDTEAYRSAGIEVGDRLVAVRGKTPETFSEAFEILQAGDTWPADIALERGESRLDLQLDSEQAQRLSEGAFPKIDLVVSRVMPGSPAARAGLESGDRIHEIDGGPVDEWQELQKIVSAKGGETVTLAFSRGNDRHSITLIPQIQSQQTENGEMEKVGRIGIQNAVASRSHAYGFWEGLWVALKMLFGFITLFLDVLWRLLTGGLSVKLLGGPVGIAQYAGESLRQGSHQFLMFLGVINANLGFVNLIPFFLITDGGLIFLFLIEAVRRRRMSIRGLERWHKLGWAMVLTLLVMATYNDLMIRLELGEKVSRGFDALRRLF